MDLFDIYIAYIPWKSGGKTRPILVLGADKSFIYAYSITTKYDNKSDEIKANYFKINDWKQAGLNKESYIDTNGKEAPKIPRSVIKTSPIGKLSENDKMRFLEFLSI